MQVTMIGLDIAKRAFQVHGIEGTGKVLPRRKLQRGVAWALLARSESYRAAAPAPA